jgi:hypothetical protein
MANTYKLIASSTVGSGGAASIDFTSIPATYTDLLVKASSREESQSNLYLYLRINGVTSSSYTVRALRGSGSARLSYVAPDNKFISGMQNMTSETANTFGNYEIYFPNYTNTSNNKSFFSDSVSENNASTAYTAITAGLFSNTSAISSLSFFAEVGDLAEHSTFYLYGIKNS